MPGEYVPEPIFWAGSLGSRGYESLRAAAAAGGFARMAISPLTICELFASGRSAADVLESAVASGVTLTQLDGVSSWAPIWHPESWPGGARKRFDFSAEQSLAMASALELDSLLLAGAFDPGALELDVLAELFGAFCDAARARGMRVVLEFVPFRLRSTKTSGSPSGCNTHRTLELVLGDTEFF
jgi:sugar phosphate isomerase/epimerase